MTLLGVEVSLFKDRLFNILCINKMQMIGITKFYIML